MSLLIQKHVNVNTPKVGDILLCTTGYEASIAYWAVVVEVLAKRIKIQSVGETRKYNGGGGMDWDSTVNINEKYGPIETKAWKDSGNGYRVKHNSYSNYYKYTGNGTVSCYNHH